jgi:hypothetical protein
VDAVFLFVTMVIPKAGAVVLGLPLTLNLSLLSVRGMQAERLDVSYIEHWSITGDVVILLKTVIAVLRAVGSY